MLVLICFPLCWHIHNKLVCTSCIHTRDSSYTGSLSAPDAVTTCIPSEMLTNMLEGEKEEEEKETLREEITDLEDVLRDIVTKVRVHFAGSSIRDTDGSMK